MELRLLEQLRSRSALRPFERNWLFKLHHPTRTRLLWRVMDNCFVGRQCVWTIRWRVKRGQGLPGSRGDEWRLEGWSNRSSGRLVTILCCLVTWWSTVLLGDNNGKLGDGDLVHHYSPVPVCMNGVLLGKKVIQITVGREHTIVLPEDMKLFSWTQ